MKTALMTLALVAALAPSFALADALIDVTHRPGPIVPANPVDDSLNHAHYDMPQLHSDAINGAVLHKSSSAGTNVKLVAKYTPTLKCSVSGTPSEFPNDLLIANAGLAIVPAGTKLTWKAAGEKGSVVLAKALSPGQKLRLNNVLDGGIEAGSACTVRAIAL